MSVILLGRSCSGKDTILNSLIDNHGFNKIVAYTTRPIRETEIEDKTYHYISLTDFMNKINEGFFGTWQRYITEQETWYYGISKEDLLTANNKTILILTPKEYRELKNNFLNNSKAILVYSNIENVRKRLKNRGDNPNEAERRIKSDIKDFKGIENEVDRIIYNNDDGGIEKVVTNILNFLNKENN